jgi:hypothetical protein
MTPEDEDRATRQILARLHAHLPPKGEPKGVAAAVASPLHHGRKGRVRRAMKAPRSALRRSTSAPSPRRRRPARSDAILLRYHVVNKAARRALEEHWQAQLAASPKERAEFDEAFATYTDWLRVRVHPCPCPCPSVSVSATVPVSASASVPVTVPVSASASVPVSVSASVSAPVSHP